MKMLYEHGWGVPADEKEALVWYERAARLGSAAAAWAVGRYYEAGVYLPRNGRRALSLYRESAARGAGEGMYQLACCYAAGRLTARSLRQARLWCRRAVEAHPDAPVDAQARALLDELERADG